MAGSVGNPNKQALKNQSTPLGRTTYLNYASTYTHNVPTASVNSAGNAVVVKNIATANTLPTSDGATNRIYPQAYWFAGPFGAIGEYVVSTQHLAGKNINNKSVDVKQE